MATADQYAKWIVDNADKKGSGEFDIVAAAYQDARANELAMTPTKGPLIDKPTPIEGFGKGMADAYRGITGLVGIQDSFGDTSVADAQIAKHHPMAEFAGNIAANIPLMFIPGGNTVKGAALIGAGSGFAMNRGDLKERSKHGAIGAAGGAIGAALPYSLNLAGKILAPFGSLPQKEKIAGTALNRVVGNNSAVIARLENPTQLVNGSLPTTAEAAQSGGLSALQRFTEQANPEDFAFRRMQNANARTAAIKKIAGDDSRMANALERREALTSPLYNAAKAKNVPIDAELTSLLRRPSMKTALSHAENIAAEQGMPIDSALKKAILDGDVSANISGEGLHWLKIGLDALRKDPKNPLEGQSLRALEGTINQFGKWRERNIPEYAIAQQGYQLLSKPINRMEIGQDLLKKVNPALTNYGPLTRETAQSFAKALQESAQTAKKATGFKGATIENTLTPAQLQTLNNVAADLSRKASADELGRGIGSNTFQNLAMNGIAEAAGIPSFVSGLLQTLPTKYMVNSAGMVGKKLYAGPEEELRSIISRAMLNPKEAARIMKLPMQVSPTQHALRRMGNFPGVLGASIANYADY